MSVCVSQEGNINQIRYPDVGHPQLAFDGYCVWDVTYNARFKDYSPGSGVTSTGFGPATLTQTASCSA